MIRKVSIRRHLPLAITFLFGIFLTNLYHGSLTLTNVYNYNEYQKSIEVGVFESRDQDDQLDELTKPLTKTTTTTNANELFGKRNICPSTLSLLNTEENFAVLQAAYAEAEAFHNGGGNLKSVETYLNDNIDTTFKKHGIQFTPSGSDEPLSSDESITETIRELLKKNDVGKRGGYNQRVLPGKFTTENQEIVHGNRLIEVLEPFDGTRWDFGLGPIASKVCKSVDRIIAKGGSKFSYEDKFMCSFNDLTKEKNYEQNTTTVGDASIASTNTDGEQDGCEMMSIGSNGQWGFEENIVDTTKCITRTFDCTTKNNPKKPNSDSVNYYPYCISSKNEIIDDFEYATYFKMVEKAGMTKPPALFKMDVEGFEFDVMSKMLEEAMVSPSEDSKNLIPSQIYVELHYATRMYDIPWILRTVTSAEIAMFMGMMYKRGGYLPVHYEAMGPGCHACAELLFVRVFCD